MKGGQNMKKVYFAPEIEIEEFNILSNVHTITISLGYESEYENPFEIEEGESIEWD